MLNRLGSFHVCTLLMNELILNQGQVLLNTFFVLLNLGLMIMNSYVNPIETPVKSLRIKISKSSGIRNFMLMRLNKVELQICC